MRDLIVLTACFVSVGLAARADVIDHTVTARIGGRCEQLVVAGVRESCAGNSIQYQFGTRGTRLSVPLQDGQEVVFAGNEGRRPKPGEYRMALASVYHFGDTGIKIGDFPVTGPLGTEHSVKGECRVLMSSDGANWRRLECHGRDASGARYDLMLLGDGGKATFMLRGQPVAFPVTPDNAHP